MIDEVNKLAKYIGLEKIPKSWNIAFDKIKDDIPNEIKWLNKEYAERVLKYYKITDNSFKKEYFKTINMINSDNYLKTLCYLWHYILYIDKTGLYKDVWNWKVSKELFENEGNYMMPVVALLSGYDVHIENMKKRNFDNEQIEEQIKNINECCTLDRKRFDIDGIRFSQMVWGSYFMKGKIIQVGRLQYEYEEEVPDIVKRHKEGDCVYIHIPRGEKLDIKEVEKSIEESREKIKKFYPEIDINNLQYYTNTWLLSNDLDDILDKDSNIIKFKNKFDIIEQTENIDDFLNFVFQEKDSNVEYKNLREDTKLQRELKQYLLSNKQLHIGLGILKEEV